MSYGRAGSIPVSRISFPQLEALAVGEFSCCGHWSEQLRQVGPQWLIMPAHRVWAGSADDKILSSQ